jgi:hypothetical protein
VKRSFPVSLNKCTTTQKALVPELHIDVGRKSSGDRRRARLRKGIDRWHLSVTRSARQPKRCMTLALTFASADPMAARGAIMTFWDSYRKAFAGARYFSWAEFQRRGALHYHAIVLDPPWLLRGQAVRWITRHWPHASITPNLEFRSRSWLLDAAGRYVKAYAKKPRKHDGGQQQQRRPNTLYGKEYQQAYDEMPREIRTFESNQLEHLVAELDLHLDRLEVVNIAPPGAPWHVRVESFWAFDRIEHVPAAGGCRIPTRHKKKRRRQTQQSGAASGGSGGSITRLPVEA